MGCKSWLRCMASNSQAIVRPAITVECVLCIFFRRLAAVQKIRHNNAHREIQCVRNVTATIQINPNVSHLFHSSRLFLFPGVFSRAAIAPPANSQCQLSSRNHIEIFHCSWENHYEIYTHYRCRATSPTFRVITFILLAEILLLIT